MKRNCKKNIGLVLLLLMGLMASCGHTVDEKADAQRVGRLHQLDELLGAQSPDALKEIEKGMREAKDSMAYYECYVRRVGGSANRIRPTLRSTTWTARYGLRSVSPTHRDATDSWHILTTARLSTTTTSTVRRTRW